MVDALSLFGGFLGKAGSYSDFPIFFMQFTIFDLLNQWEYIGVFDFLLPFLLIFSIIFGILTTTKILGGHKGVNLIIALVIGLMALRLNFVSAFFTELFPRFAIGLSVLIVIVILAALFIPDKSSMKGWLIGFAIAGVVIGILVVLFTFNTFYWFDSFFWNQYWGLIVGAVILVIVIVAIFVTAGEKPTPKEITLPIPAFR